MIIGVDIDNVCVNTTEAVLEWLAERGAPKKAIADIKTYWLEKNFPSEYSLLIKEAFEAKSMWKKVKLIDGAKEYLQKLYEDGHEIYFCTSSLPQNLRKKMKHLTRNLGFLTPEYVDAHTINTQRKQLIAVDVLIDDCLSNLIGKKTYTSICYRYPWNEGRTARDENGNEYSIWFVSNWEGVYEVISKKIGG